MSLRAGVAGSGSMGRNHARCYSLLGEVELTAVYDADLERAKAVADEFGAEAVDSLEALPRLVIWRVWRCRRLRIWKWEEI